MEKSFTAQLGAGEPGPWRAPSQPRCWNCSAVTSAWCVHLGMSAGAGHTQGLGDGESGGEWGSELSSNLPGSDLPLSTSSTSPGCPSQHRHPGLTLVPNAPFLCLHSSHATGLEPKPGDSGSPLAFPLLTGESVLSLSSWTPATPANADLCKGCVLPSTQSTLPQPLLAHRFQLARPS